MSDTVITVENLGKKYIIGHQRERYTALRDVMANTAKDWGRRLVSPFSRNGASPDPTREEIWALKDVSFEVKQGERLGIIGRNGAGKSTLLKILSRITEPTEGRVRLRGRVASLLEVGTGFHPELTGRENIYLNGAILGMSRAEIRRKFDEIVAFAEVEKFLDTPVKRYSSGMYVRLAFAVAAHLEPEILLVDEVLAVGDAEFQKKCLGKMDNIASEGRTVLFVSHNMAAIHQLCSSAVLLKDGIIVCRSTTSECIESYLESSEARSGQILSHITLKDPSIRIKNITVNSSQNDSIDLPPTCSYLDIMVSGFTERPAHITIEARIYDTREQCLAFFTPRQFREQFPIYTKGHFSVAESIALPDLNQGEYYLSIYIVELKHELKELAILHKAVRLIAEGTPTITGWVFKYARGNGWMLLQGRTGNFGPDGDSDIDEESAASNNSHSNRVKGRV